MQQRPFALQTLREAIENMDVIYATTLCEGLHKVYTGIR
jgi:hypothetical protein